MVIYYCADCGKINGKTKTDRCKFCKSKNVLREVRNVIKNDR